MSKNVASTGAIPDMMASIGPTGKQKFQSYFLWKQLEQARTLEGELKTTGLEKVLSDPIDRIKMEMILGTDTVDVLQDVSDVMLRSKELENAVGGKAAIQVRLAALDRTAQILAAGTAGASTLISLVGGRGARPTEALAAALFAVGGREVYRTWLDSDFSRKWRLEGWDFPAAERLIQIAPTLTTTARTISRVSTTQQPRTSLREPPKQ